MLESTIEEQSTHETWAVAARALPAKCLMSETGPNHRFVWFHDWFPCVQLTEVWQVTISMLLLLMAKLNHLDQFEYNCPSISMGDWFHDPLMNTEILGCSSSLHKKVHSICI